MNTLFWIAHIHFEKETEGDRMRRFHMAEHLIHHQNGNVNSELHQLMIAPSSLSREHLQTQGNTIADFPFGEMIEFNGSIFFVKYPSPRPPFEPHMFDLPPPPPHAENHFESMVLQDLKPHSTWLVWSVFGVMDLLMLLFFGYIVNKLIPLHRLKNAIIDFKEGDKRLDIEIEGKDEIAQITGEFNHVLEKIAAMKESRSLFLRNILHELKTPIMKGSLTAECLESSQDQERLKRIFSRMNYLLGEFSTMERFNSGEWDLNLREYRFVDLLDHACDILLCTKSNFEINGEGSGLILTVDFELFAIALKNLLDNALKYSDTKPTISILSSTIEISNLGNPLPHENRCFEKPFNRTYESSMTGLGLGLYITHAIVKKHGFTLDYHYDNGMNTFRIVL